MTLTDSIKSPCIKVCAVDGETGFCLGCGRTLPEIGQWTKLSDQGRETVMARLPERIRQLSASGKR